MEIGYQQLAASLRVLCADMVESAKSGHPGMPLGMADVATVLWRNHLKFNPLKPDWYDRDRFVLSAGHGSALLYALLYLVGFEDVSLQQIGRFRQLHSGTAGHPEYGAMPGIETTTGPLGQGLANAVGMALAERKLTTCFGADLVDHYTYCIVGDGCLMEGVSQEAISLAGHLKLSKLVCFWDNNSITIDGPTSLSTSDQQIQRFQASGWNTIEIDGHDYERINTAIIEAKQSDRPTLIACKTIIGFGAPNKQGTAEIHGSALGAEEIQALRDTLGWKHPTMQQEGVTMQHWRECGKRSEKMYTQWMQRYEKSSLKEKFDTWHHHQFDDAVKNCMHMLKKDMLKQSVVEATRKSSERCLEALNISVPNLLGGSADLTPSNNTRAKGMVSIQPDNFSGNYIHYGIREHAMAGVMNGVSLHKGLKPYGGTFLCFTDYARPAIRLSALMKQPVVYVMTHDSIGLGEDGPTHQPIEHLASLRAIPNLNVFRPCDSIETAECWEMAIQAEDTPSILALSRQNLPLLRKDSTENLSAKGAYVIRAPKGKRTLTLVATGSEVHIAIEAAVLMEGSSHHQVAVVSMPCWELFDKQSSEYQVNVLGSVPRIGIEAASTFGWHTWVDHVIGIDRFGESAPAADLYEYFKLTPHHIKDFCFSNVVSAA